MIFLYLAIIALAVVGWVGLWRLSQELNPRVESHYDGEGWILYLSWVMFPIFATGVALTIYEGVRLYS